MTPEEIEDVEEETEFEQALVLTEYGLFQYELIAITGIIYLNAAIAITILSFVLPAATCDYQMESFHKGWLSASPMLGMLFGSYFWGCLADTKGRKTVLVWTLCLDGGCGLLSSILPYYSLFTAFRFFNGFNVAGSMSIVFAYLGEFQQSRIRETVLSWMEVFWTLGVIILPIIAWLVVPIKINYEKGDFFFHGWNLFVLICSLPSIILGIWLTYFPESPKFLWEQGDTVKALEVLGFMFARNTGRDVSEYPVSILKDTPTNATRSLRGPRKPLPHLSITNKEERKILFQQMWKQTKRLCRKPHLTNTILTCSLQFGLTASYYTLMIWFPELFHRYSEVEAVSNRSTSVCELSKHLNTTYSEASDVHSPNCNADVQDVVFLHTVYIGLACIPTSLMLPLCVHKLGVKVLLAFGLIASGFVTVGLLFVQNSTQNMIVSCVFESLTSYTISTVYIIMVDLFPTNLRVMASSLSMTFGRGGALLGNLMFGFLIDAQCVESLLIFAFLLFICGLLCYFIPTGLYA